MASRSGDLSVVIAKSNIRWRVRKTMGRESNHRWVMIRLQVAWARRKREPMTLFFHDGLFDGPQSEGADTSTTHTQSPHDRQ